MTKFNVINFTFLKFLKIINFNVLSIKLKLNQLNNDINDGHV
jgi:hypothetical protein